MALLMRLGQTTRRRSDEAPKGCSGDGASGYVVAKSETRTPKEQAITVAGHALTLNDPTPGGATMN